MKAVGWSKSSSDGKHWILSPLFGNLPIPFLLYSKTCSFDFTVTDPRRSIIGQEDYAGLRGFKSLSLLKPLELPLLNTAYLFLAQLHQWGGRNKG